MAKLVSKYFSKEKTIGKQAGELREIFVGKELIDFELVNVHDNAPAISEIEVLLEFQREEDSSTFEIQHIFRLCYEVESDDIVARGYKEANWKIMLHTIQELEYMYVREG
ncbi:hypothetical protein P9386_07840 [Caldifermentibacillus hisashii]|uniref:hypothetical protein n=1 Tax=Caldifermentibacillus hisashii TaxID=996558 RepID=UPI002E1AE4A0|nr:hypothetical protein [Caldifermentibacillus hisashii]